jgi:hypothetical protein
MKSSTALVTATLTAAILVAASLVVATGTRGADAPLEPLTTIRER